MKGFFFSILTVSLLFSCSSNNDELAPSNETEIVVPKTYAFKRDKVSNIDVTEAQIVYKMANELYNNLGADGLDNSEEKLNNMFAKGTEFSDDNLNSSGIKLRDLVASSENSTLSPSEKETTKSKIDAIIKNFVKVIIPAKNVDASKGVAGNVTAVDEIDNKKRYLNKKGLEADQSVSKILFGGLFLDQISNNYLSENNLKNAEADNTADVLVEGKNYTKLEHDWDMAYGYIFGLEYPDVPLKTVKTGYLNAYLKANYTNNTEFNLFFDIILKAFKTGRQAVVVKNYTVMNAQAKIIRETLSKMMAVRTVHYLWKSLGAKGGKQLHALSEVYGFFYALQFAHLNGKQLGTSYTKDYIAEFDKNGGAWDVSEEKIQEIYTKIASDFGFSPEDAKN